MRADMAKVLVERPRLRGHWCHPGPGKGVKKRLRKMLDAGDSPPAHEGIRRPYTTNRKHFNEHLGPLRRYIDSQVGRPWDRVYSDICARIDRGNVVQKHILTHLFEYVVTDVVRIGGVPCYAADRRYGQPLADSRAVHLWYACPKSGLLKRVRRPGRRGARKRWRAGLAPSPCRPSSG